LSLYAIGLASKSIEMADANAPCTMARIETSQSIAKRICGGVSFVARVVMLLPWSKRLGIAISMKLASGWVQSQ